MIGQDTWEIHGAVHSLWRKFLIKRPRWEKTRMWMVGEQTLDLPSPSATAWDFIAFQGPLKPCTLGPLTSTPHCWLGPWVSLSCPSVYSQSTCLFGCFSHISAERSVFNKPFSWSVKSVLKLIFVFLSREWLPGVLKCILLSIKIWLIPNTVLLPKWPLCLHSCLSVKKKWVFWQISYISCISFSVPYMSYHSLC